jgi:hypothetical protein
VRDRSSPTRSAAPENIFNTLQAQLQSLKKDFITRTIDVQNYCKKSDKDQHTNTHTMKDLSFEEDPHSQYHLYQCTASIFLPTRRFGDD